MAASVRLATKADADAVAGSLALAFADDPVMAFLLPDDASRVRRLKRFFQAGLTAHHLLHGASFTDADRSGAALWNPPGHWHMSIVQLLRAAPGFVAALGTNIPKGLRALSAVQRAHPVAPHYYLAVLGTRPEQQGRGLGSSLLRPILERCDAQGHAAYLESSKESNLGFYRRHGFEVTGEIRLPGGPLVWPMWREARRSISALA